jgi:hypothetical protein
MAYSFQIIISKNERQFKMHHWFFLPAEAMCGWGRSRSPATCGRRGPGAHGEQGHSIAGPPTRTTWTRMHRTNRTVKSEVGADLGWHQSSNQTKLVSKYSKISYIICAATQASVLETSHAQQKKTKRTKCNLPDTFKNKILPVCPNATPNKQVNQNTTSLDHPLLYHKNW